jgi:hypothetical protein
MNSRLSNHGDQWALSTRSFSATKILAPMGSLAVEEDMEPFRTSHSHRLRATVELNKAEKGNASPSVKTGLACRNRLAGIELSDTRWVWP